ncbi:hypothetical protein DYB37_003062 [Aphanomyces astaci]|uniref:Uncharacterized protein n=1 Tax=Aphanomyces astaci TaxID=112090 RepID=A0A3R7A0N5_APHAT|nr:hypothetical protein DYB34_012584 [Aphanomyces astaci]RHY96627.1 hypothetical protein DYB35_003534 [Aphanomyces astaci]RHZ22481.1 hypothetical protein DYB37_003062 [Aphanomyces astaci]
MNQLLEVEFVHFPSHVDTFRVRVDTSDGHLPFKLWVENTTSKHEWYTSSTKSNVPADVDLVDGPNGHVEMTMGQYKFNLAPVDADTTTKLEDRVHALEAEVTELKKTTEWLQQHQK